MLERRLLQPIGVIEGIIKQVHKISFLFSIAFIFKEPVPGLGAYILENGGQTNTGKDASGTSLQSNTSMCNKKNKDTSIRDIDSIYRDIDATLQQAIKSASVFRRPSTFCKL